MADEFDLLRVMRAIADLPFKVVKAESPDRMLPAVSATTGPVFRPYPQQGVTLDAVAVDSFGSNDGKKTIRCAVGYALFYEPAGTGRTAVEWWPGLMDAISDVVNTFTGNDTIDGVIDVRVTQATQSGPVLDMAGVPFHGAVFQIAFDVFFN